MRLLIIALILLFAIFGFRDTLGAIVGGVGVLAILVLILAAVAIWSGFRAFKSREVLHHLWETVRRAFAEFLTLPTLVIVGFLLLAVATIFIDAARISNLGPAPKELWGGLFSDAQATRGFLGVIAGSIITVTSITLSLLLIAVQQGAASLTSLVFDQFLRRRTNQVYFGFFIGLALYSLTVLASVTPFHQPVYGATVAGVMALAALYILLILIYTTIDQMRPVVIIKAIHDHSLRARANQLPLIRDTRRVPLLQAFFSTPVTADRGGFLVRLDVAAIAKSVADAETEVVILPSLGGYVAFGDLIAEIRMAREHDVSELEAVIRMAAALEDQRSLHTDPAYGVAQLATIGWTSISTAKSDPDPGLLTIWRLRDLLARWLQMDAAFGAFDDHDANPTAPVVYSDNLPEELMRAFESLLVVASESMQHQNASEIYRMFANLFERLPIPLKRHSEDLVLRSLSGLGDHILTSDLAASLTELSAAMANAGGGKSADAVRNALRQLERTTGHLNSRSTRVNAGRERPRPND